ncbi:MAG: hypothetical protein WBN78_03810 [Gammaproteobacteria bacterium]
MTDSRSIDLIQARLDGVISAADLKELEIALQADAELVDIQQQMGKLTQVLDRMEAVEPPPGLRNRILGAVQPSPQRSNRSNRSKIVPLVPRRPVPQWFGYGIAAAFGAIVAAVALQIGTIGTGTRADVSALVGTISKIGNAQRDAGQRDPGTHPAAAGQQIVLNSGALTGLIETSFQDGLVVLDFNLTGSAPVEITAEYSPSRLSFNGFVRSDDAMAALDTEPGLLRVSAQRDHRYAVFFAPGGEGPGVIELRLVADGRLIEQRSVEIPATN